MLNVVVYDATVKTLTVYLTVVMFLSYGYIEGISKEVLNWDVSQGSLVNWVDEAKKNAVPIIEKIKKWVMHSAVVDFDEFGLYSNKKFS